MAPAPGGVATDIDEVRTRFSILPSRRDQSRKFQPRRVIDLSQNLNVVTRPIEWRLGLSKKGGQVAKILRPSLNRNAGPLANGLQIIAAKARNDDPSRPGWHF